MPKGKYTNADIDSPAGGMPNAGPMGKYTSADIDAAPPPSDDDTLTNIIGGAASRVGSYISGAMPHSLSDVVAGPMSGIGIARAQFENIKRAAEDVASGEPSRVGRGAVQGVAPGMGTGSLYDMSASGKTPEAVGAGGVDALALMLPELEKGAGVVADSAAHPIVRGAGRVIRDFDITKPFKSIGENVAGPAMDKLGQMRAARGRPQLQSPLDPSAGVRVQGGGAQLPRVPSPAEDMLNSLDAESAVRRAPNKGGRPPARVPSPAEHIQSPLEPGQGTVAPRQFGDAPVSADASHVPTLADEMVSPLEQGEGPVQATAAPRSMQPTADMTSGGGGANYSADDLANLISKHDIPPASGEIVGGTPAGPVPPAPETSTVYHGTHADSLPYFVKNKGIPPREFENEMGELGAFVTDSEERAQAYAGQPRNYPQSQQGVIIQGEVPNKWLRQDRVIDYGDESGGGIYDEVDPDAAEWDLRRKLPMSKITNVRHLRDMSREGQLEDNAILQAMREDLDAHGRNALHEESTDFAARNKVGKSKTGKAGYGFNRKLPEAE